MTPRFLLSGLLAALAAPTVFADGPKVSYNRDIRPIFADHCFTCHGPDAAARKSKLRLDIREQALKGGESGDPALLPGQPEASALIARVLSHDPDEVMPPPKAKNPLKPAEIEKLRQWIAQGAEYQPHWAFIPPEKPELPAGASGNAIDAFIRARLTKEELQPSSPATPEKLIRRVHLDLTGLPPSPQEVDEFVNDPSPQAWQAVVEKLLASPHYGERWGRHWLDAARYADSNGYEKDPMRYIWFYRDWVIGAFNRDLPYDQFIIEQLAGDLLPNATTAQISATGFHRNTMTNIEGGTIDEEYRVAAVKDRIATTGQVASHAHQLACHGHSNVSPTLSIPPTSATNTIGARMIPATIAQGLSCSK